ncbi:zincin-like metallopeptidase domain-containing protein [Mucilaginibacter gotjawali]|uniref:DNA primase TraC n=2 Tax=Mucilaginibacter gotjawali TaxID=1550579 RepID=A0A0X8X4Q2_9SPHI|nr:zincin-like metallopeptidase domain-containing protein [Mucilaginibacter gotjawali]MBB3058755.1 antirestriction protein ArdC [Mucilaginibacter gotjawali]BAU55642.1 DNA primase TraC [Mucilaginibacter gotjawali]
MSNNFKSLNEKVSEKMISDLKRGISVFQKPDNSPNSMLPFNIESGNRYTGAAALTLLMQRRDDPRWATFNQANRNRTAVLAGSTGTFINFHSNYAIKIVFENGQPVLRENGSQRTEKIRLKEPELVEAKVFNGEQLRKLPKWEKEPQQLTPAERAQVILDNSKAVIEHGGDEMVYDAKSDTIVLPEMEQFAKPEQYYAEALHQLAHRTAAQELDQSQESAVDESSHSKIELRTNLASLFLSKELNLPYDLNYHVGYVNSWAQVMKGDPAELFNAAGDAQKIVDRILGFERQIAQQQEAHQEQQNELPAQHQPAAETSFNPDKLNKGEVIPYDGKEFKVVAELKNKVYQMQDLSDNRKFKMSSKDALFANLLEARNYSQENVLDRNEARETGQDTSVQEEENQGYSISI